MSKSKKNGVDPQELIAKYGADTARLFVMFAGPPEDTALWSDTGVEGAHRFLRRLWTYAHASAAVRGDAGAGNWRDAAASVKAARREIHFTLKQANYDYERIQYNTVVSAGMKMLNALEAVPADAAGAGALAREGLSILLRVLYPVVPHTAWSLWNDLGFAAESGDLLDAPWPQVDPEALIQDEIELVLQINGKLRGRLTVPAGADAAAIEAAARASAEVAKHAAERAGEEGDHRAGAARQCRGLNARRARAFGAADRARAAGGEGARSAIGSGAIALPRDRRCGFHLRGDVTYAFSTLYINSPANGRWPASCGAPSGRRNECRRRRGGAGDPRHLQRRRRQAGTVADGRRRVREYQLTKRVAFALHDANGKDWMPAAEIVIRRSYTFNNSEVLAREAEEARLSVEMQTDVVRQILRRLQTARKPA